MSKNYVEIDEKTGLFKKPNTIHLSKPEGIPSAEIETDDGCHLHDYAITKDGDTWVANPLHKVEHVEVVESEKKPSKKSPSKKTDSGSSDSSKNKKRGAYKRKK